MRMPRPAQSRAVPFSASASAIFAQGRRSPRVLLSSEWHRILRLAALPRTQKRLIHPHAALGAVSRGAGFRPRQRDFRSRKKKPAHSSFFRMALHSLPRRSDAHTEAPDSCAYRARHSLARCRFPPAPVRFSFLEEESRTFSIHQNGIALSASPFCRARRSA